MGGTFTPETVRHESRRPKITQSRLDAQLERYHDLPRTIGALHDHLRDPNAVDVGEMFARRDNGAIEFAKDRYKDQLLFDIARSKPDYLEWMLRGDFFDDTKAIAAEALADRAARSD
jgi:DNA polymerase III subunit epsilon